MARHQERAGGNETPDLTRGVALRNAELFFFGFFVVFRVGAIVCPRFGLQTAISSAST